MKKQVISPLHLVLIASLLLSACKLFSLPFPTSGPSVTPTALPQPLPPLVVETIPPGGSQIPLQTPITLFFNQPMDKTSVESAITGQPALEGSLIWQDDATLVFTPDQPLTPASTQAITLAGTARASNGLAITEPFTLTYQTADYLRLTQFLPEADAADVIPTSAIVASFNQPVVPLGGDPNSLPAAFMLQPAAQGKGEWINTSTFIFYPEPPLNGGVTYTARLNNALISTTGSPIDPSSQIKEWSFSTARPRLVSIEPSTELALSLDVALKLTFNQPMDPVSVKDNFRFSGPAGVVSGMLTWNDDHSVMTYKPASLLGRSTNYTFTLNGQAQAGSGAILGQDLNVMVRTYGDYRITSTSPNEGGYKNQYDSIEVRFSAPIRKGTSLEKFISIDPAIPNLNLWPDDAGHSLSIYGNFEPERQYTLIISPGLKDTWEGSITAPFYLHFRTPPAAPQLMFPYMGSVVVFTQSDKPQFYVQATNLSSVDMTIGSLPLEDFFKLMGEGGYELSKTYTPPSPKSWRQHLELKRNKSESIPLGLSPHDQALIPGLYYLSIQSPDLAGSSKQSPLYMVASNYNLTFKISASDALIWVTDLRTNMPVPNAPLKILDASGRVLASGQSDASGLWHTDIPTQKDPYQTYYAMLGQTGQEEFSIALSSWNQDVSPWNFGYRTDWRAAHTQVYLYTDRPIYRPGQTVYFRAAVRQAYDGRYKDPDLTSLSLSLSDWDGEILKAYDLPLSTFGTVHGSFALPEDAKPGYYTFQNQELDFYASFQVADYRKPEINLSASMNPGEAKKGQEMQGLVEARYFFDAPVDDLPVHWILYSRSDYFSLPEYTTGNFDTNWFYSRGSGGDYGSFGKVIAEGDAATDQNGMLPIRLSELPSEPDLQRLTLEVTAQDESGQPVSARASALLHPADFYIGLQSDLWVGRAGLAMGFNVLTVDWAGKVSPSRRLHAEFKQVTWERQEPADPYDNATYIPVYTPVSSSDMVTGSDGKAHLSFTPPQAGTYVLEVQGSGASSQILLWVGGGSQAVWPNLPNQQLQMTADRDTYLPGQTAQIFIPNPLGSETSALVTVERGMVRKAEVIQLEPGGTTYTVALTDEDAPNVYLSATLVGGREFRQGYLNLEVAPQAQTLDVTLTSEPERSQPGGEVNFGVRVTDDQGKPVQGEFSLAVVDLAALALADPNAPDILPAFYGEQPLGVRMGLSLAADSVRGIYFSGGRGGGGGDGATMVVRDEFPDTAYWNATLLTAPDGSAQVNLTLPDNLTTWQVDVRGLTQDTRVGQAVEQVISTKELLVRPVTPRFLVAGDHLEMAAIVHNNTSISMQGTVTLQGVGFLPDDPKRSTQEVTVLAGGRTRVSWWGTVQNNEAAELVFSAQAGGYQDATRPGQGALPILHYTAPQTFVSGGVLPEAGSRLEVISLPRSFTPTGGKLDVEMAPSLSAALLDSLEAMEVPAYTGSSEMILSYFLPNLETYRAQQAAGLESPKLKERLEGSLDESVRRLLTRQNEDGGWGWSVKGKSNPYTSTYVLFGLWRAKEAGVEIDEAVIQKGRNYLIAVRPYLDSSTLETWQMDRLAFIEYVLGQTGYAESQAVEALYSWRDHLSPWANALLALTLESLTPGDSRARDLISNLETSAIRSASGAHWESHEGSWQNPGTPLYTTATVVYALAQRNPASAIIRDAVRYLASQRGAAGIWGSSYENAWVILGLTEAMKGSGDLQADFSFSAALNGAQIAEGKASGPQNLTPVSASLPLENLHLEAPNGLSLSRQEGNGNLYYRAALQVDRPVESAPALTQGMEISRTFHEANCDEDCVQVGSIRLTPGAKLNVRLALTLAHDAYYLMVEDHFPAGSEVLNQALKTSQQGEQTTSAAVYDAGNPYSAGWGWWYFDEPQIYDDHVLWTAEYLPAGSYMLTYTLIPLQAGEYRIIPARAWMAYFPEVQGTSAGEVFEIED